MTNSELLASNASERLLTGLERQRQLVLKIESSPAPCPNCATPLTTFEATGVSVDEYDFGATPRPAAKCTNCGRGLRHVLPMFGWRWHWALIPEACK